MLKLVKTRRYTTVSVLRREVTKKNGKEQGAQVNERRKDSM